MDANEQFSKISSKYDSQRSKLIPKFDQFYGAAVAVLDIADGALVADIGAGTGILAEKVRDKFPSARLRLVDISEEMLGVERERFCGAENVDFILSDFASWRPDGVFDAVVSALAIHHVCDAEKISLYKKIFDCLSPRGVFVNAEQVLGSTVGEIENNAAAREQIVREHMSEEEGAVALERLKLDRCATVESQLQWLADMGFSEVKCVFSHLDFAVLVAKK